MKCLFQVKINSQNEDMLRQACELFMGKKVDEIRNIALETMVSLQITTVLVFLRGGGRGGEGRGGEGRGGEGRGGEGRGGEGRGGEGRGGEGRGGEGRGGEGRGGEGRGGRGGRGIALLI